MAQQQKVGRPTDQKADEWQKDLNPNPTAGQNHGLQQSDAVNDSLTAEQIKELHSYLSDFATDELTQIVILPEGSRLEQGAKYIDLKDPERKEITAMGNMEATADHWYVPKTEIEYPLWNRLRGVEDPKRTDASN
ncbi:hypothetical protein IQ250_11335 [Pseudanabaenaceae cyanobacterium LEGE 13415]|nr:hypothetical protein [Pseudanabaenaceae cyanobacterium LEGE 13415]